MNSNCAEEKSQIPEYNLEFQGSVWNLKKGHFLWIFTQKCLEITLLLAKRVLFFKCYKGQRPTTGHWFLLDYYLNAMCKTVVSVAFCHYHVNSEGYIYILTIFRGNPGIVNFKMTLHNFITRQNFFIHEIKNIWKLIKMSFRKCKFSHNWTPILSIFCLDTPNFW